MILVVGLGCQRGCEVHSLLALLDSALAEAGIDRSRVTALASIDHKRDEPGLLALAQRSNLPLQCFSAEHLAGYYSKPVLWSRSYCVLSCGGAPLQIIQQYIQQQDRPDD